VLFGLVRPCNHCPFRSDRIFGLRRAPEIARSIFNQDHTFACHETVNHDTLGRPRRTRRSHHCAGALILHEKLGRPNWRIRFAHHLGLYDPARLDMTAPIFDTADEFIRSQGITAVRVAPAAIAHRRRRVRTAA
jgi:hypothetical protein